MAEKPRRFNRGGTGATVIETAVALCILAVVVVAFLGGLAAAQNATIMADERATAESLAQSQLEYVKKAPYVFSATTYTPAPLPVSQEYAGYSATVGAAPVNVSDDGIQRITIAVARNGLEIISLSGYKENR